MASLSDKIQPRFLRHGSKDHSCNLGPVKQRSASNKRKRGHGGHSVLGRLEDNYVAAARHLEAEHDDDEESTFDVVKPRAAVVSTQQDYYVADEDMRPDTRRLRRRRSNELTEAALRENRVTARQQARMLLANWTPPKPALDYGSDRKVWETTRKWEEYCMHYSESILHSWLEKEKAYLWRFDFLKGNKTIRPHMCSILNAWMVEIVYKFDLRDNTLWHTYAILNRYLSLSTTGHSRDEFQMVGSACMWIAAKYNDVAPMCGADLVYICRDAFTEAELRECELKICRALNWEMDGPTAYNFAVRFSAVAEHIYGPEGRGSIKIQQRIKWLCLYGLERAALEYHVYAFELPSKMAAAALLMAINCVGQHWTEELERITGYEAYELKVISKKIRKIVTNFSCKEHRSVIKKYSCAERAHVSSLRIKPSTDRRK